MRFAPLFEKSLLSSGHTILRTFRYALCRADMVLTATTLYYKTGSKTKQLAKFFYILRTWQAAKMNFRQVIFCKFCFSVDMYKQIASKLAVSPIAFAMA